MLATLTIHEQVVLQKYLDDPYLFDALIAELRKRGDLLIEFGYSRQGRLEIQQLHDVETLLTAMYRVLEQQA